MMDTTGLTSESNESSGESEESSTFEQRLAGVYEGLRQEQQGAPGEEPEAEGAEEPATAPAPATDAEAARAAAREARDQRFAQLRERESRAKQARERREERDRLERLSAENEQLRRQTTEAATAPARLTDAESFFEAAEKAGVTPDQLVEYLRDSAADPQKVASASARKAAAEMAEKLERRIEEQEARFDELRAEEARRETLAVQRQAEREILHLTVESAETAPYSSGYLKAFGPEAFVDYANQIADALPEGAGLQAVHDHIEANLEMLARLNAASPKTDTETVKTSASGQARTVSNSLASERASVQDNSDEWEDLPYEERVRRLRE